MFHEERWIYATDKEIGGEGLGKGRGRERECVCSDRELPNMGLYEVSDCIC